MEKRDEKEPHDWIFCKCEDCSWFRERLAAANEMMDKDMREKAERFRKWMKGER